MQIDIGQTWVKFKNCRNIGRKDVILKKKAKMASMMISLSKIISLKKSKIDQDSPQIT